MSEHSPDRPKKNDHRLTRRDLFQRAILQGAAVAGLTWAGTRIGWWPSLAGQSASSGITGVVTDLLTTQPIAGVAVSAIGITSGTATTDSSGRYEIALPAGTFELHVSAPGYLSTARTGQAVQDGAETSANFALILANPTPAQQDAIYAKVVQTPEWPMPGTPLPASALGEATAAAVTVPDSIVVRWPDGSQSTMPLDDYLRHVVPGEMPSSWPQAALQAQAVAARSYAVAYSQSYGYICTTTSCQYYGANTYDTTDQAVWSTHGRVATYNGAVIWAFFFAQCNGKSTRNSEQALANTGYQSTCTVSGWSYVAYCRARSCSGHAAYSNSCGYHGHGVGMCQWGARDLANEGLSYDQILNSYYTGIQIVGNSSPPQQVSPIDGYLARTGTAIVLSWTGSSSSYTVVVTDSNGYPQWTTSTSLTSAVVPTTLPSGTYYWYVTGNTGGSSDGTSATRHFVLANPIYQQPISGVSKG